MPRTTFASHLLMHSVNAPDQSQGRPVDDYTEAQKRHDGSEQPPEVNPERHWQQRYIQKYGHRQQKALANGDNHQARGLEGQEQLPQQVPAFQSTEKLAAPPQNEAETKAIFAEAEAQKTWEWGAKVIDNDDILGNAVQRELRAHLPTAVHPRTDLTGGMNPWEISDATRLRHELRDTRIIPERYNSVEEMHEEGYRQIEARRVPEDVEEGRPSPSNVGRILLLPRPEVGGNWMNNLDLALIKKAGSEEALYPRPLAHYKEAIEANKDQLKRHGWPRQMDMLKKLESMGQPGRQTTMQEALVYQKARENDSPEQRHESEVMLMREALGDTKSSVDKILQPGWRVTTEPGRMYHLSQEGREKAEAKNGGVIHDEPYVDERVKLAHERYPAFFSEIARRRSGHTPLDQLDAYTRVFHPDDAANVAEGRARIRQDEMEWRERQHNDLETIHRIQESRDHYQYSRPDESAFGSLKGFALEKWHDFTHEKIDENAKEKKNVFWDQNSHFQSAQRSIPSAPPGSPMVGPERMALGDATEQHKAGWWFFKKLQHFAPEWQGKQEEGAERTRFIDTLSDDELSMMSL